MYHILDNRETKNLTGQKRLHSDIYPKNIVSKKTFYNHVTNV